MFFLAALRKGSCSIHRVRFLLRAEALFRRTMVHDSGLKPSLSRSTFPIAPEKVFATRLRLRMNLGAKTILLHATYLGYIYSAEGTALYDIPSLQKAARKSAERKMRDLVRSVNFGAVKFETAFTDG